MIANATPTVPDSIYLRRLYFSMKRRDVTRSRRHF